MSTTNIYSPHSNVVRNRFRRGVLVRLVDQVRTWNGSRVAINQLNALSDRLLKDIGIERQNIAEAVKRQSGRTGAVIARYPYDQEIQQDIRKAA